MWRTWRVLGEMEPYYLAINASTRDVRVLPHQARTFMAAMVQAGYAERVLVPDSAFPAFRLTPAAWEMPVPPKVKWGKS
jgi:hypothetical protein